MASGGSVVGMALMVVLMMTTTTSGMGTGTGIGMASAVQRNPPCVQKLLPCQAYLHATTTPPPATCCLPLMDLLNNDAPCLCNIFNNEQLLKSFNVTKEEAVNLPKLCGAPADLNRCKNVTGSPPTAPAPPDSGELTPPPSPPSSSSSSSSSSEPTSGAAASDKAFLATAVVMVGWTSVVALMF